MKMIKIDPPGSFCQYEAVFELIRKVRVESFIEIGCGAGDLSLKLCERGMRGVGLDFSDLAIEQADLMETDPGERAHDLGISMMVMEHVENDVGFIKKIASVVKPGGYIILGVPGRRNKWSIEDDTVGHLRRYDREDLQRVMMEACLLEVEVWSVAVPISNLLFGISNFLVNRSSETEKVNLSLRDQTASSGVREIPFKTVFPPVCKLILNRFTLYPLFVIQRMFYHTGLGLTMLGIGKVPQ
jgi:SAM-dependent methyltransferase